MNLASDGLANGRYIKLLAVADDFATSVWTSPQTVGHLRAGCDPLAVHIDNDQECSIRAFMV